MPDSVGWDDNGSRWRGVMETKLADLRRDLDRVESALPECRREARAESASIHARITRLEVKVAWFAGAFSLLGGLIGGVVTTLASHLVG